MTQERRPPNPTTNARWRAAAWGGAVYLLWVFATWLLEGRIRTLLRPDAGGARFTYALIGNQAIGLGIALSVLRALVACGILGPAEIGFQRARHTAKAVASAVAIGGATYLLQDPPSLNPWVIANAFAQVFVVSAAEIVVCWAAVGAVVAAAVAPHGRGLGICVGAIGASLLFGLYHLAHSPPFNSLTMVLFLCVIGLATSIFFFVSRDLYGAIIFHNFLALTGVVRALDSAGRTAALADPMVPLFTMAGVSAAVLLGAHALWFRVDANRGGNES